MRLFLILAAGWLLSFFAAAAPLPADTTILQVDRLPATGGLLLKNGWHYHVGDNPAWAQPDFDDSGWSKATVFNAAAVGPKEGYLDISWNSSAQFIWGSDLFADNTVLVRLPVVAQ